MHRPHWHRQHPSSTTKTVLHQMPWTRFLPWLLKRRLRELPSPPLFHHRCNSHPTLHPPPSSITQTARRCAHGTMKCPPSSKSPQPLPHDPWPTLIDSWLPPHPLPRRHLRHVVNTNWRHWLRYFYLLSYLNGWTYNRAMLVILAEGGIRVKKSLWWRWSCWKRCSLEWRMLPS